MIIVRILRTVSRFGQLIELLLQIGAVQLAEHIALLYAVADLDIHRPDLFGQLCRDCCRVTAGDYAGDIDIA